MGQFSDAGFEPGRSRGSGYQPGFWFPYQIEGMPRFTLQWAEFMLADPTITLGLNFIKGPIQTLRFFHESDPDGGMFMGNKCMVRATDPAVGIYVARNLNRFWQTALRKALRAVEYGTSAGEIVYRRDAAGVLWFHDLIDFRLQDCRFWTIPPHREVWGISVNHLGSEENRNCFSHPKFWWHIYDRKNNRFFGVPRLFGAFAPWAEKWISNGAADIRRLWFRRNAFDGGTIYYPSGSTPDENGIRIPNRDIARQYMESKLTGHTGAMPSDTNEQGQRLWAQDSAKINGSSQDIREYAKDLDAEMLRGLGIPPEVVSSAGETGSGYGGRKVPQAAFYASLEEIFHDIIVTCRSCFMDALVRQVFGDVFYEILPAPLSPNQPQQIPVSPSGQSAVSDGLTAAGHPQTDVYGPRGGEYHFGEGGKKVYIPPGRREDYRQNLNPGLAAATALRGIRDARVGLSLAPRPARTPFEEVKETTADRAVEVTARLVNEIVSYCLGEVATAGAALAAYRAAPLFRAAADDLAPVLANGMLVAWLVGVAELVDGVSPETVERSRGLLPESELLDCVACTDLMGGMFQAGGRGGWADSPAARHAIARVGGRCLLTRDDFAVAAKAAMAAAVKVADGIMAAAKLGLPELIGSLPGHDFEPVKVWLLGQLGGVGAPLDPLEVARRVEHEIGMAYCAGRERMLADSIIDGDYEYIEMAEGPSAGVYRRSSIQPFVGVGGRYLTKTDLAVLGQRAQGLKIYRGADDLAANWGDGFGAHRRRQLVAIKPKVNDRFRMNAILSRYSSGGMNGDGLASALGSVASRPGPLRMSFSRRDGESQWYAATAAELGGDGVTGWTPYGYEVIEGEAVGDDSAAAMACSVLRDSGVAAAADWVACNLKKVDNSG